MATKTDINKNAFVQQTIEIIYDDKAYMLYYFLPLRSAFVCLLIRSFDASVFC